RRVLASYGQPAPTERQDPDVTEWYDRFEVLNGQFLKGTSAWQQDGDDGQLDRLLRLVERQIQALGGLRARGPRYGTYRDRFARAIERVDARQPEYVVSPTV